MRILGLSVEIQAYDYFLLTFWILSLIYAKLD